MSEQDLYLAVLSAADDCDVDAVHAAYWRNPTDLTALYMLAMAYGVEVEAVEA